MITQLFIALSSFTTSAAPKEQLALLSTLFDPCCLVRCVLWRSSHDSISCIARLQRQAGTPSLTPSSPLGALLLASQDTISCIARLQRQAGITDSSLLNFVVSDGTTLVATRYVYPETERAASLYYAEGGFTPDNSSGVLWAGDLCFLLLGEAICSVVYGGVTRHGPTCFTPLPSQVLKILVASTLGSPVLLTAGANLLHMHLLTHPSPPTPTWQATALSALRSQ